MYIYTLIYILCLAHSLGFQASTMSKHCLVSPLCLSWRCLLWLLCADLARKHKNWARWALRVVHGINRLDSTYIRGHIVLIRLFHIFLCFKRMRESIFQESATNFHPWCKVKWTLFRRFSERKTVWRFACQLKSPIRFAPILRRWGHKKISAWCPRFWKGRNTFHINTGRSRSMSWSRGCAPCFGCLHSGINQGAFDALHFSSRFFTFKVTTCSHFWGPQFHDQRAVVRCLPVLQRVVQIWVRKKSIHEISS